MKPIRRCKTAGCDQIVSSGKWCDDCERKLRAIVDPAEYGAPASFLDWVNDPGPAIELREVTVLNSQMDCSFCGLQTDAYEGLTAELLLDGESSGLICEMCFESGGPGDADGTVNSHGDKIGGRTFDGLN